MSWGIVAYAGITAVGIGVSAMARKEAGEAEAGIEMQNAAYYREQAEFAADAGRRAQMVFDRESVVLEGEQTSILAAAGLGEETSSNFLSKEALFRQQERNAIGKDTEANVKLALLRGGMSEARAAAATDRRTQTLGVLSDVIGGAGNIYGMYLRS